MFRIPAWGIAIMVAGALDTWTSIPARWIAAGLGLYILKDLAIYPWVWQAYEHRVHDAGESLVGSIARDTGVPVETVVDFVNACHLCGWLTEQDASASCAKSKITTASKPRLGMIANIRERLGL